MLLKLDLGSLDRSYDSINMRAKTTESIIWATEQQNQSTEIKQDAQSLKWIVEGCFANKVAGRSGGGVSGVVAVLHLVLWIAACSGLTGCGGLKCCLIASSCLLLVCTISNLIFKTINILPTLGPWWSCSDWTGGKWRSHCGSSFSQVRLTPPVVVGPEPVPDTFRWLLARQQLCLP